MSKYGRDESKKQPLPIGTSEWQTSQERLPIQDFPAPAVALGAPFAYGTAMEDQKNAEYYKRLIDQARSYHDLVILRSRCFGLMERTLSQDDYLAVKDYWNAKAKDENLPITPPKG